MLKPYKTLLKNGCDEFIINKSRFIGYASPAESEEAALEFIKQIRLKHKDASHNCYAYVIGANKGIMRYSDDGEPGGTAGLPMMEVLKQRDVVNCAVVVTRYFGGVLLGAGGLVRAYTQGTAIALNAAGTGIMHPSLALSVNVVYSNLGRLEYALGKLPVTVTGKEFTDKVCVKLLSKAADSDTVTQALMSAVDGKCEIIKTEEMYLPWQEE